jgi:hypothetical protein
VDVVVTNQFGEQELTAVKADQLCVPAIKDMIPTTQDINHFKCYRVRGRGFVSRTATIADQFEAQTVKVLKPYALCNPVDKNGEGIPDPTDHLTCCTLKQPTFAPRNVIIEDQALASVLPPSCADPPGTIAPPAEADPPDRLLVRARRATSPTGARVRRGRGWRGRRATSSPVHPARR